MISNLRFRSSLLRQDQKGLEPSGLSAYTRGRSLRRARLTLLTLRVPFGPNTMDFALCCFSTAIVCSLSASCPFQLLFFMSLAMQIKLRHPVHSSLCSASARSIAMWNRDGLHAVDGLVGLKGCGFSAGGAHWLQKCACLERETGPTRACFFSPLWYFIACFKNEDPHQGLSQDPSGILVPFSGVEEEFEVWLKQLLQLGLIFFLPVGIIHILREQEGGMI